MRRRSTVLALTLAAACWLAAGPGFVGLEAALLCRYHERHMSHDGPCFCAQMSGALDATAADALHDIPAPVAITVARLVPESHVSRFPLPPSPSFAPETPPPNACA